MDDGGGRKSPGTGLIVLKCDFCGADLGAGQGRCSRCGAVVGEEHVDPSVLIVLDGDDGSGRAERSREADLAKERTRSGRMVSVWRAGPSSLGLFAKISLTAAVLAVGYLIFLLALAQVSFYGVIIMGLIMLLMGCFDVLAAMLLWTTWRPTRTK